MFPAYTEKTCQTRLNETWMNRHEPGCVLRGQIPLRTHTTIRATSVLEEAPLRRSEDRLKLHPVGSLLPAEHQWVAVSVEEGVPRASAVHGAPNVLRVAIYLRMDP